MTVRYQVCVVSLTEGRLCLVSLVLQVVVANKIGGCTFKRMWCSLLLDQAVTRFECALIVCC